MDSRRRRESNTQPCKSAVIPLWQETAGYFFLYNRRMKASVQRLNHHQKREREREKRGTNCQESNKVRRKTKTKTNKQNNWRPKCESGYYNSTMFIFHFLTITYTNRKKKNAMAKITIAPKSAIVSNQRRTKISLHVRTHFRIFFFLPHFAKPNHERLMQPQCHKSLIWLVAWWTIIVLHVQHALKYISMR